MHCIHKRFCALGTVILFLFANFLVVPFARAQDAAFTVEGVRVDITSKSAVAAREEAFEKAQKDAFAILAGRLLASETADPSRIPDVDTISTMINDYEISNEQLSTVRYVATYTFRFNENGVRRFFNVYGATPSMTTASTTPADSPYSDAMPAAGAAPALILPFLQYQGRMTLWSPYNSFMKAWNRAGNMDGLVPLSLPMGDIADVSDIGDDEAMDYNNTKMGRMLERYGASEAVILVATPDASLAQVKGESEPAAGALNVAIYRTDRGYAEQVQGVNVSAAGQETLGGLMDKAVQQVQNALRGEWKGAPAHVNANAQDVPADQMNGAGYAMPGAGGNVMRVRVPFGSLKEWAEARRALTRTYGVQSVSILSVKPTEAYADIRYSGDINRLALSLGQSGLQLDQAASGGVSMAGPAQGDDSLTYYSRGTPEPASGGGLTHDLYLQRYRR